MGRFGRVYGDILEVFQERLEAPPKAMRLAVNRRPVNAEVLSQSYGPGMRPRRGALRALGLCHAFELAPSLVRHSLERTGCKTANWSRLRRRRGCCCDQFTGVQHGLGLSVRTATRLQIIRARSGDRCQTTTDELKQKAARRAAPSLVPRLEVQSRFIWSRSYRFRSTSRQSHLCEATPSHQSCDVEF